MNRPARLTPTSLIIAAAVTASSRGDVIATVPVTYSVVHGVSGTSPVLQQFEFNLIAKPAFPPPGEFPTYDNPLFDGITLTQANVGQLFTATPDSDPDFAAAASLFTNGQDNAVYLSFLTTQLNSPLGPNTQRNTKAAPESAFFSTTDGIDLSGYTLTRITERLDSLTIIPDVTPDPSFPAFHGPQFNGQITLIFEGTPTPEPASAACALLSITTTLQLRRRRRR